MVIRKASTEDACAICKICCEDMGYECSAELVSDRLNSLDENREIVFVSQTEDGIAGVIHAEIYRVLYFEPMVNILGLAVLSGHRRQGIGRALLDRAEKWAGEKGIKTMRLNSGISRKGAHSFYRAMGYDDEKEQLRFIKKL